MRLADVVSLWGRAAGRCSAAGCDVELILDLPASGRVLVGERAHVIARSPRGPRGDRQRPGEDSYDNLILLCPTHHRVVDKAPGDHPPELLLAWKSAHEARVRERSLAAPEVPVLWDVSHPFNHRIAGRDEMLQRLGERLAQDPVQVLHGLRGVGKSQVAVTFAYRHAPDYCIVYWIDARPGALERGLRALAGDIGLDVGEGVCAAQRAVQRCLAEQCDYLLVLDRARDVGSIEPWLPERPAGHIIITSTNPAWRRLGHPELVEPLDADTGAGYLAERTGYAHGAPLARTLGGLPLALEQAASFVETTGVDLEGYARQFEEAATELLGSPPLASDYDQTVLVTLSLAIRAVDTARRPLARTALRLLSYLDASRLPRRAMTELMRHCSRSRQPPDRHRARSCPRSARRPIRRQARPRERGDARAGCRSCAGVAPAGPRVGPGRPARSPSGTDRGRPAGELVSDLRAARRARRGRM